MLINASFSVAFQNLSLVKSIILIILTKTVGYRTVSDNNITEQQYAKDAQITSVCCLYPVIELFLNLTSIIVLSF